MRNQKTKRVAAVFIIVIVVTGLIIHTRLLQLQKAITRLERETRENQAELKRLENLRMKMSVQLLDNTEALLFRQRTEFAEYQARQRRLAEYENRFAQAEAHAHALTRARDVLADEIYRSWR